VTCDSCIYKSTPDDTSEIVMYDIQNGRRGCRLGLADESEFMFDNAYFGNSYLSNPEFKCNAYVKKV